jgi:hypothetical protein
MTGVNIAGFFAAFAGVKELVSSCGAANRVKPKVRLLRALGNGHLHTETREAATENKGCAVYR